VEDFLSRFIGKKIDVYCGGASSVRGEVLKVEMSVLHLRDDEGKNCYVAIDKIVAVWEAREDNHRAGFVPAPNTK
jgi:hypothetical protein